MGASLGAGPGAVANRCEFWSARPSNRQSAQVPGGGGRWPKPTNGSMRRGVASVLEWDRTGVKCWNNTVERAKGPGRVDGVPGVIKA